MPRRLLRHVRILLVVALLAAAALALTQGVQGSGHAQDVRPALTSIEG